jgi:hypothetical protein
MPSELQFRCPADLPRSLPSWLCGFDSRYPLLGPVPPHAGAQPDRDTRAPRALYIAAEITLAYISDIIRYCVMSP